MKFQMKFGYILVMHRTFKLLKVHILRKNVSYKTFLTNLGVSEVFRRVVRFKEVCVIYKLFLEYNVSRYVFQSVFESIIFVLVLRNYMLECLVEIPSVFEMV